MAEGAGDARLCTHDETVPAVPTLVPARRERLATAIRERALGWALGRAEPDEIDRLNIYHATHLAMVRAVEALAIDVDAVLVDGNRSPVFACPAEPVVKGDGRVPAIAAASILAKVARDAQIVALHERFPEYGFARHKGYGTKAHREAIAAHGPCPLHRQSFAGVKEHLERLREA